MREPLYCFHFIKHNLVYLSMCDVSQRCPNAGVNDTAVENRGVASWAPLE